MNSSIRTKSLALIDAIRRRLPRPDAVLLPCTAGADLFETRGATFGMLRILAIIVVIMLSLAAPLRAADYLIGEGDTLVISVWGEKELGLTVKVRPDGKISMPAVGEVAAANMTVDDLQAVLTEKITKIVKKPIVTVIVADITNNKVYIFGGGVNSGVYSLTQRTTLLQLLCQLGQVPAAPAGAAATAPVANIRNADLKNAYVLRQGKKIKQNFHSLFLNGYISEDIVIEPGDAIFIPALMDKNVYVMGAVNVPRSIEYRDGLTVMGAILEAGGFTKFADQNDTVIYRKNGNRDVEIPIKAKKLIKDGDLSQNVRLQPGDYIVVKEGLF